MNSIKKKTCILLFYNNIQHIRKTIRRLKLKRIATKDRSFIFNIVLNARFNESIHQNSSDILADKRYLRDSTLVRDRMTLERIALSQCLATSKRKFVS